MFKTLGKPAKFEAFNITQWICFFPEAKDFNYYPISEAEIHNHIFTEKGHTHWYLGCTGAIFHVHKMGPEECHESHESVSI